MTTNLCKVVRTILQGTALPYAFASLTSSHWSGEDGTNSASVAWRPSHKLPRPELLRAHFYPSVAH